MGKKTQKFFLLHKTTGREVTVLAPSEESVRAKALRIGDIVKIDRLDKNMNYIHTVWEQENET